ncbi:uncharacterized protein [Elaeis guineensis]|uniref:uncharacterized protein n=1 Tax=Elaeis guineensis var. tenera TaxID=51953 RepID=UPI003C6CE89C
MTKEVRECIRTCSICQRFKHELVPSPGLLQPLPLPSTLFSDITMDFIEGLSVSQGRTVIFVVDRLSKFSHFISLKHPFSAKQTTPFEALYGIPSPLHLPYFSGDSNISAVDIYLRDCEFALAVLKYHLQWAFHRMKEQVDKHRTDRQFEVGDWVLDKIGKVAYKLNLPAEASIHNVFHVSQLKPGSPTTAPVFPLPSISHIQDDYPQEILDRRMVKRKNSAATQLLIHWRGHSPADAS